MRGGPGYVLFRDGTRIDYDQPRDTLDPRYLACIEHRTACICREAEWAEENREWRGEFEMVRRAIGSVIAGHPDGCACHGCEIARRAHLSHLAYEGVKS